MKKLFSLICVGLFLIAACNSNKTKDATETNSSETNTQTTDNTSTSSNDDMTKMMEEMKKKPALSTDQIKAMLPEDLMGMKRVSFSANSMMGYGIGEAKYKSEDDKEIRVMIYDCVGEAGVAWYNLMFWGMNMEQQDENGYKKTVNFNGGKAIESYEKDRDQYALMFGSGNRLLVNIEGERTGLDAVKQAAQSLNLKTD